MNPNFQLKTEDEFLLCCTRTKIDPKIVEKLEVLLKNDLEWEYLIDLAYNNSLGSLLYFQLSQLCSEKVPKHFMNQLKDHYYFNVRKNLLMMSELFKILDLFESEEIKAIPYKGPVLANQVYGNISLREFSDLDIFIDKKDVLLAIEILVSAGYEPKLKFDKKREFEYLKLQREYQFFNKERKITVEIQWNLFDISLSFPNKPIFAMDQIESEVKEINRAFSSFSDEDILLILSLHTVTHLWSKLSWICDIAELIKNSQELQWDEILKKAQYLAVERILYLNLDLVSTLFDVDLPPHIHDKIENDVKIQSLKGDVMKIIFDRDNHDFINSFFLRFKIREKNINKINDFLKIMFVPTSTEWEIFQKSLPLYLLYALVRPMQIFNKAIK